MQKTIRVLASVFALTVTLSAALKPATAAPADRYLHVKVENGSEGESVNVNIPLTMAESVLPAIHNDKLHEGRVTVSDASFNGVDVEALLNAIHSAPDNEFVTIKQKGQDIHVLKQNGNIVVKIRDNTSKDAEKVDVTVPIRVADALFSTVHQNELDVAAAIRALNQAGQTLAITVESATEHVHVWVDEQNSQ
ncbi:MAG TPA: hypothetical protein VMJ93_15280 [Verrucomicrobiae bacterium]|nr:hypothetical protein [Verrucomicrobiae bacterium]